MLFDFSKKLTRKNLSDFAELIKTIQEDIPFKVSSRGWCYLMEQRGYINKTQFDKVESAVNRCRKEGLLPVDFVKEEEARAFSGVESQTEHSILAHFNWMVRNVIDGYKYYHPDWWIGEKYYIQMIVEKVDLISLFEDVCHEYHIPIANAKGWSSISQRAEYARRFKEAEERGLKCVLLYCGDHDPDGLRISDTIRKNLEQISDVTWDDGVSGYDPQDLIIHRFGLNYDFIIDNNYTWIDNLYTGSGGYLATTEGNKIIPSRTKDGKPHKNFYLEYLQVYLQKYGVRKCEANAIVTTPVAARDLVRSEIEQWLGEDALERFANKKELETIETEYNAVLDESGLREPIEDYLNR